MNVGNKPISIIIPTYNGAHKLPAILDALQSQTYKDFELIVVVDGSTDNTLDVLHPYSNIFSNIQIIYQSNKGRAAVRNEGARKASGYLLIFFDDDMRPKPTCVEEHIRHHRTIHKSILTGAQIDDIEKARTDLHLFKCYLSRQWEKSLLDYKHKPLPKNLLHITAANFSIAKELFHDLGGFDNRLNDAEDYVFAINAFENNIPIYYKNEAFAWHDDFITFSSYLKRRNEYKKGYQKLQTLFPQWNSFFKKGNAVIKNRFYEFLCVVLDNFNFLIIFPKKIRFKIYEWILF